MLNNDFWKGRRALVTGASGFLGAHLLKLLIEAGADPVGYDLIPSSPCLRAHGLEGRIPVLQGSVTDSEGVERVLKEHKIEVCFHLAGQSMIEDSAAGPSSAFDVNVRGTWTVLEACRRAELIRGVACASSNHIYGAQEVSPFPETAPLNQLDVYGASKACADLIIRTYAHQYGVPAVAVRNTNTFGPADPHLSHVVTGTITRLLRDEVPVIKSDGSPTKAYLYAQDTLEAYMLLAEHADREGVCGEAFNVTAAEPISVRDLVDKIVYISGKSQLNPLIQALALTQKDSFEHLASKKIQNTLDWKPRFSLEEGLRQTYYWYAEHGIDWLNE